MTPNTIAKEHFCPNLSNLHRKLTFLGLNHLTFKRNLIDLQDFPTYLEIWDNNLRQNQ